MTLLVETGAGLATSESYVSVADADAYAQANGLTWPAAAATKEAALRRATLWIDTTFRARFPGYRRNGRLQALEWPRVGAYLRRPGGNGPAPDWYGGYGDASNYGRFGAIQPFDYIPSDAVPVEVIKATVEAASREALTPGALMGDVTGADGQIKRESAGDHSIEYFANTAALAATSSGQKFKVIDAILSGVLIADSGFTARASRG